MSLDEKNKLSINFKGNDTKEFDLEKYPQITRLGYVSLSLEMKVYEIEIMEIDYDEFCNFLEMLDIFKYITPLVKQKYFSGIFKDIAFDLFADKYNLDTEKILEVKGMDKKLLICKVKEAVISGINNFIDKINDKNNCKDEKEDSIIRLGFFWIMDMVSIPIFEENGEAIYNLHMELINNVLCKINKIIEKHFKIKLNVNCGINIDYKSAYVATSDIPVLIQIFK
jgi:hypothetical protein